ncbi:MAG: peptide chain release factor N(5)-glutamine methyltransferase [Candidatus Marinimicrobia bacterium]|nr:peptide chain release factor N(5)-glutamine methyltransferase [Candidatus Neomarinimicrobiota bacterium]
MKSERTWMLMEILKWSVDYLTDKGIKDAQSSVEWLLCEILSCSRMDLYLKYNRPMSDAELARYRPLLLKCAAHQPVQQLVGTCEFYGLKLAVNDKVLIPRPETERLVERCIKEALILTEKKMQMQNAKPLRESEKDADGDPGPEPFVFKPVLQILDIGAGSGCISIALAKHIPNAELFALEKSQEAIGILQRNIRFHDLEKRVHILQEDVMHYLPEQRFDIIVSNPPYIAAEEIPKLEKQVSYFEPFMALSDAGDGLAFYRFFAGSFPEWLLPEGFALLEFGGPAQRNALKKIFAAFDIEIIRDYQQDDRVLLLKTKNGDH